VRSHQSPQQLVITLAGVGYLGDLDGVAQWDPFDNCPDVGNSDQLNADADALGNACDNCPNTSNSGQQNTDADPFGDACELTGCETIATEWTNPTGDGDCDGFPNDSPVGGRGGEVFIGTDAADRCADTATPNDEQGPSAGEPLSPWPTDINDDRWTNLADVSLMSPAYNKSVGQPGYDPRRDFNANDAVNLSDISLMSPFYNKSCG